MTSTVENNNIKWSSRLLFHPADPATSSIGGGSSSSSSASGNAALEDTNLAATLTTQLSDKITLPTSVLEAIVAQAPMALPSPLTFRLSNPAQPQQRATHVGVREFSGVEGTAQIPLIVAARIGLEPSQPVVVQYVALPKATSLTLAVLEDDDAKVDDWKALLEAQLRSGYTALTKGDTLVISDPASRSGKFYQCLVSDLKPEDAACIIDTDIDLHIVTPNASTQQSSSSKGKNVSQGLDVPLVALVDGTPTVLPKLGPGRDAKLIIDKWDPALPINITLSNIAASGNVNVFVGTSEYSTSSDAFLWSTLLAPADVTEKTLTIMPGAELLRDYVSNTDKLADKIYIVVHTDNDAEMASAVIAVDQTPTEQDVDMPDVGPADLNSKVCVNCHKTVPAQSYQMHAVFCERNNVVCPRGCGKLFLRRDGGVPEAHWHCDECTAQHGAPVYGNSAASHTLHTAYFHEPVPTCPQCLPEAPHTGGFPSRAALALHLTTACSGRLHICRFCHLRVPQEETTYLDRANGFTGHETRCGSKTTECTTCGKVVKLSLLASHMDYHNSQRLNQKNVPVLCANGNCVRTVAGGGGGGANNGSETPLGLCAICFGPLHSTVYDPTGVKLAQRIERRYVIQATRGCGKPWCANQAACASANPALRAGGMAQVMPLVQALTARAINDNNTDSGFLPKFEFCVDEMTTKRKLFVDMVVEDEQIYARAWVARAVELAKGNEPRARQWLETHAIKLTEQ
ncbi:hypothetical protein D0Z00_003494 [Geotrichum galactomycetum]|uniref:Uncharacterized protein n=1 Tax=Geotrichum galactomycetum TaxID=27317 RepID=A0ACB6V122_9ASCO|nr:hypothetical protein D0Z00_003494 [Geotrichum candidum]